ncbi:P-loop containing nucleoside triphosphate hydrolase protein [Pavlovales sp. CCMP2436]|nr:P-loop containing nucleoside triphosphate hydrolase protein [Pavlovales sp. CCMP2436]|mmetsp:Transcript_4457/g.11265  ORF Transcript_4457/g.11265 Transcript_4457/m.11265 type:complete len:673 (+) Transcript_4457:117-2135(+)
MANHLKSGQERGSKGRPKKGGAHLGQALANQQRAVHRVHQLVAREGDTMETERGKGKLRSVTECDDLEEFMTQATMANTDFTATERAHMVVLKSSVVHIARNERAALKRTLIRVPRRPRWHAGTTPEELTAAENQTFLEWRRGLAEMEDSGSLLTPFERNLEVWKQLWRVLERSDLVVQIVDARNPLFFKCDDLEAYVNELPGPLASVQPGAEGSDASASGDSAGEARAGEGEGGGSEEGSEEMRAALASVVRVGKISLLLLNKADLLPESVRKRWADFFAKQGVRFAFFSALTATEDLEAQQREHAAALRALVEEGADEAAFESEEAIVARAESEIKANAFAAAARNAASEALPPEHVYGRDEFLALLLRLCPQRHGFDDDGVSVIAGGAANHRVYKFNVGFVGYPNVGKSSTINALVSNKKVSVSATPGKTKHFQTLACPDEPDLTICDCPGLVFPALAGSKAQMYCDGVLPIDQIRDHAHAMDELVGRVPRRELERTYACKLALRAEADDPEPLSRAQELLVAHGLVHSFLNKGGGIDESKAARVILKDLVNGRLRHWVPPPDGLPDHDELRFATDDGPSAEELEEREAGRRQITVERYIHDQRFDAQEGVRGVLIGVDGGRQSGKAGKHERRRQMEAEAAARMRATASARGGQQRLPDRMVAVGKAVA